MIIVFIRNPITLKDATTLPLSVWVTFGKLIAFDAANLKDPSEMRLDPFPNRLRRHIPKLSNLGVQSTRLINKLLPFLLQPEEQRLFA